LSEKVKAVSVADMNIHT